MKWWRAGWIALAGVTAVYAHSAKTQAIDQLCAAIRSGFVEAQPEYFSGPDPWSRLNDLPQNFTDFAVATVYSHGSRVRWLVLDMPGPGWYQTTQYFFDETGRITKRVRELQHQRSNVRVEEREYFEEGKLFKTEYHHSALRGNKEEWELFFDPKAPEYTHTGDLPILFCRTEFKRLADAHRNSRLCTRCTKRTTAKEEYLVKFTRPTIYAE